MPAPCPHGCSLATSHAPGLVALSVALAGLASYVALDLAGRTASARGRGQRVWLTVGSLVMGVGIWSMHFVAMLAFHLHGAHGRAPVPVAYDLPRVLLSVVVAVAASARPSPACTTWACGPCACRRASPGPRRSWPRR